MSDNNNPQPLTHMTDFVTPQPTAQDYLTNAQSQVSEIYNATLKLMRDTEEAKALLPDSPNMEGNMSKLVAFVWNKAIRYANNHVEDRISDEISIQADVDLDIYDDLDIRIRGKVETDILISDHLSIEIPQSYDGVQETHDEILQEFLQSEAKRKQELQSASVTAHEINAKIDLSKNNA